MESKERSRDPGGRIVEIKRSKKELVSHSIIQTALINKALRLKPTYWVPLRQEHGPTMKPASHAGIETSHSVQAISDELASLLSVI
jgi:hypothetical protein